MNQSTQQEYTELNPFFKVNINNLNGRTVVGYKLEKWPLFLSLQFFDGSSMLMFHELEDEEIMNMDRIDGIETIINQPIVSASVTFHSKYGPMGSVSWIRFEMRTEENRATVRFSGYNTVDINDTVSLIYFHPDCQYIWLDWTDNGEFDEMLKASSGKGYTVYNAIEDNYISSTLEELAINDIGVKVAPELPRSMVVIGPPFKIANPAPYPGHR